MTKIQCDTSNIDFKHVQHISTFRQLQSMLTVNNCNININASQIITHTHTHTHTLIPVDFQLFLKMMANNSVQRLLHPYT